MPARLALVLVIAVALAACGGGAAPAPAEGPSGTAGSERAQGELQLVELDSAGEGERALLRYDFATGVTERGRMRMGMAMRTRLGEGAPTEAVPPPTDMDFVIESTERVGALFRYRFRFESVTVDPAGAPPEVVAQLSAVMSQLERVHGSATIDDRGRIVDSHLELPPDLDPAVASTMRSVDDMMRQMVAPLPEEPVGVGAEWKTESMLQPAGGPRIRQVTHHRLVAREGDRIVLEITSEQTGIPGPIAVAQPGVEAHLDALTGRATGAVSMRLDRVVPLDARSAAEISQDATLRAQGEAIPMHLDLRMELSSATR